MSVEQNKQTVRRFLAIIDSKDFDSLTEVIHADYVHYGASADEPWTTDVAGATAAKKWFGEVFQDHSTWENKVQDIVGEGDKVAVRFIVNENGTPSKNGVAFFRLLDGKIVGDWPCFQDIGK
jgi:ketosteroid isomerase-like protein